MAFAEKRGNTWRARWKGPDGKLDSKPGFPTRRAAENYGNDQEAALRAGNYVDPRDGQITLTEWVNKWFPAQDLEMSTLSNYKYQIEVLILPEFGHRAIGSLTSEEIAGWEQRNVADGYSRRTASDARSTLGTILADAIPRHIRVNPAARRKGKGKKGRTRIQKLERKEKAWPTPLQALLTAERSAVMAEHESVFVMMVAIAYTGMRWSEVSALSPEAIQGQALHVRLKLYELDGKFYRGWPKDGSARTVDLPPFLATMLAEHAENAELFRCLCRNPAKPWCTGTEKYLFLGPKGGHHRRSTFARRIMRPAADGWYPAASKKPATPVLVDATTQPGRPLVPWPAAVPGEPFTPPTGRGRPRIPEETPVASWLPILKGLTPHGLRHGHQTWMDDAGIREVLQFERMGHEMQGMRGVYVHITPAMRERLATVLESLWAESLAARAKMSPRSALPILDGLLAPYRHAGA